MVVVVVVVESLVAALSGFVVAELEKPARGNWDEVERPSDICKERCLIETEGLSMRKGRKKKRETEKEKKKGKKESTEKEQPAQQESKAVTVQMSIRIRR